MCSLRGISNYMLCYQRSNLAPVDYCDVNLGVDLNECRSTSKYDFLLSGGSISWSSIRSILTSPYRLLTLSMWFAPMSFMRLFGWGDSFSASSSCHMCFRSHGYPLWQHCHTYTKDPKYHSPNKHNVLRFNFTKDITACLFTY